MLTYLIAQASTQPTGIAAWTAQDWVLVIGAVGALIAGVIASWRRAGDAKAIAHEAKADAAGAVGYSDATQKSLDRFSARANAVDAKVADIALKTPPTPGGPSPLLLLPLLLIPFVAGCANMSDGQKLYTARASYVQALRSVNDLMEQGVITDAKTKEGVYQAKEECHAALDDAEARFLAGDKLGFGFVFNRVSSALDRLIRYHLANARKAGKGLTWASKPSSLYCSRPLPTRTSWRISRAA